MDDDIKIFSERMIEIMGSLNPTLVFLASSRAQLHMAKVAGLPKSELSETQQKIVSGQIDEIYEQIGHLVEFLKSPNLVNVLDAEIIEE